MHATQAILLQQETYLSLAMTVNSDNSKLQEKSKKVRVIEGKISEQNDLKGKRIYFEFTSR